MCAATATNYEYDYGKICALDGGKALPVAAQMILRARRRRTSVSLSRRLFLFRLVCRRWLLSGPDVTPNGSCRTFSRGNSDKKQN